MTCASSTPASTSACCGQATAVNPSPPKDTSTPNTPFPNIHGTAAHALSAAAAYSAYHGLYSDAAVSSMASAIALADAGERTAERFRALGEKYEAWKIREDLFEEILKAPLT